jgi:hypothetical protein
MSCLEDGQSPRNRAPLAVAAGGPSRDGLSLCEACGSGKGQKAHPPRSSVIRPALAADSRRWHMCGLPDAHAVDGAGTVKLSLSGCQECSRRCATLDHQLECGLTSRRAHGQRGASR